MGRTWMAAPSAGSLLTGSLVQSGVAAGTATAPSRGHMETTTPRSSGSSPRISSTRTVSDLCRWDWRDCRERRCADAPDDPDLDAHRSDAGNRATAFVRLIPRGGRTYIQYWLYYPDSNTTLGPSDKLWDHSPLRLFGRYPGFHPDDWEAYAIRIDPDGSVWVRASSHGHWQGCKRNRCRNAWTERTGWTRVSRGSHAGHIPLEEVFEAIRPHTQHGGPSPTRTRDRPLLPGRDLRERTTTSEGIRLIPLETLSRRHRRRYRPLQPDGIRPPWRKPAYRDPESDES
jgi:hypothetical protein